MKEDVGMSKPKKHANKVRWDPKLNKPLPYNPTKYSCILLYSGVSTYVGLYGSGLFNFGSHLTLFACFLGFDIPTSSFIFIGLLFLYIYIYKAYLCTCI